METLQIQMFDRETLKPGRTIPAPHCVAVVPGVIYLRPKYRGAYQVVTRTGLLILRDRLLSKRAARWWAERLPDCDNLIRYVRRIDAGDRPTGIVKAAAANELGKLKRVVI